MGSSVEEPRAVVDRSAPVLRWSVLNNGITPYLWAHLRLTDGDFAIRSWRTVLGVVPVRSSERAWPVREVHDIRVAAWVHLDRLLLLMAAVLLLATDVVSGGARVATIVVAAVYVPLTFVAVLRVAFVDGRVTRVPLCLLHIARGNRVAAAVEAAAGRATGR